jgi:GAF domain-containing protein
LVVDRTASGGLRDERLGICSGNGGDRNLVLNNPYLHFERHHWIRELLVSAIFASAADFGNVQLFDSSNGVLRIVEHHGFGREFLSHFEVVRDDDCACGTAMQRRSRVVVRDVASDPTFQRNGSKDVLLQANVRSVQSTPLIDRSGNFVGVLSTHYQRPNNPEPLMLERLDGVIAQFIAKI